MTAAATGGGLREVGVRWPRASGAGSAHSGPRGPDGWPAGAGHPRLHRQRPDDDGTAPRARRGGLARAPWRLGWNMGARADTLERLGSGSTRSAMSGRCCVVGWSLGGLFARELARDVPERVRAVVTLGSPFSGDPQHEQCVAAVRAGRRPSGRRAADPAISRQAAGADAGDLVAARRDRRAARGARAGRRARQGGRDRLHPHGVRRLARAATRRWCARSASS